MEFTRQSLKASIDAVRQARDTLARTASECSDHGASRLAQQLDDLAAKEDQFLAVLLREDAKLVYRAGALPAAGGKSPAEVREMFFPGSGTDGGKLDDHVEGI